MQAEISVPEGIHYHHVGVIWVLFLIGAALHIFLQIDSLARQKSMARVDVFKSIIAPLAFRTFAEAMIFGIIWQHPNLISQIGGIFGHPLGADEASVFAIPMNNMIAGLYGLFLDSILGYIPILKSQLPDVTTTVIKETKETLVRTTETATTQTPAPKADASK